MNRAKQHMFMILLYFITSRIDNKDGVGKASLGHRTLTHMDVAKKLWEVHLSFLYLFAF